MCCEPIKARPQDTIGVCPDCGEPVDADGDSTNEGCGYSPSVCITCHDCPCDLSC